MIPSERDLILNSDLANYTQYSKTSVAATVARADRSLLAGTVEEAAARVVSAFLLPEEGLVLGFDEAEPEREERTVRDGPFVTRTLVVRYPVPISGPPALLMFQPPLPVPISWKPRLRLSGGRRYALFEFPDSGAGPGAILQRFEQARDQYEAGLRRLPERVAVHNKQIIEYARALIPKRLAELDKADAELEALKPKPRR